MLDGRGDRRRRPRSAGAWGLLALRRRPGAALGPAVLAALVTLCLTLVPLMTRALEQAVLKPPFTLEHPVATSLSVHIEGQLLGEAREHLDRIEAGLGPEVRRLYPQGVTHLVTAPGETHVGRGGTTGAVVSLVARDDICAHVRAAQGRCPRADDEIAVAAADARTHDLQVGSTVDWVTTIATDRGVQDVRRSLRVVGTYQQVPDDRYWLGTSVGIAPVGDGDRLVLAEWITPPGTVAGAGGAARRTYAADATAATVDLLPRAVEQLESARMHFLQEASIQADLAGVARESRASAAQIHVIVPLVLGQTALMVLAVLVVVARATTAQRRHEMGLARLRGAGPRDIRRLLAAELLPPTVAGSILGALASLGVGELIRRFVLPDGVPFEITAGTGLAVVLATLLVVGVVLATITWHLDSGVLALLRRPTALPRRTSPLTWVAATLALAAALSVMTTTEATPLALASPTLMAIAVGLMLAGIVPRVANALSRRASRRGRVATGLGFAGVGRRPETRGVLLVLTVAACTMVLAVDAWAVGERNRTLRAELEAGAGTALLVRTRDARSVQEVVRTADPSGRVATTVAFTRPPERGWMPTLAAPVDALPSIAFPSALRGLDLAAIATPPEQPVPVHGTTLTLRVDADPPVLRAPVVLTVVLTTPSGRVVERPVTIPAGTTRAVDLSTPVMCEEECRLDRLLVATGPRTRDGGREVAGQTVEGQTVTVTRLAVDGRELPLTGPRPWLPLTDGDLTDGAALRLRVPASGTAGALRGDAPVAPAITVGELPPGSTGDSLQIKGVAGDMIEAHRVASAEQLPVLGGRGALVDMTTLARRGLDLDTQDRAEVWIADGRDDVADAVRTGLAARGIDLDGERRYTRIKDRYDASGSSWGLSVALVGACLSVAVAAAFLVVSARQARPATRTDATALMRAGVPPATLRRALVLQYVVVAAVGLVAGAAVGILGARLALPLLPLFTTPAERPIPDLGPASLQVGAAWSLLVAVVVALAVTLAVLVLPHAGRRTRGAVT